MRFLGFLVLLTTAATAFAGEYAVLTTGSRLRADRHETQDGKVRLYTGEGYIEMEASRIQAFEPCEDAAPAAVPVAVPAPSPVEAPKPALTPAELADAAAIKYGLPAALIRSVMAAESAGRPNAVSPKGAIGLMQLMPETARELGVNPHDPAQNVDGGVRYLRDMLVRFDYQLWHALAAYNAGPGAVEKYGTIPPYRETIQYINRIDRAYNKALQK
jgi:soluble lytic murein transglycosylase-like protein